MIVLKLAQTVPELRRPFCALSYEVVYGAYNSKEVVMTIFDEDFDV